MYTRHIQNIFHEAGRRVPVEWQWRHIDDNRDFNLSEWHSHYIKHCDELHVPASVRCVHPYDPKRQASDTEVENYTQHLYDLLRSRSKKLPRNRIKSEVEKYRGSVQQLHELYVKQCQRYNVVKRWRLENPFDILPDAREHAPDKIKTRLGKFVQDNARESIPMIRAKLTEWFKHGDSWTRVYDGYLHVCNELSLDASSAAHPLNKPASEEQKNDHFEMLKMIYYEHSGGYQHGHAACIDYIKDQVKIHGRSITTLYAYYIECCNQYLVPAKDRRPMATLKF